MEPASELGGQHERDGTRGAGGEAECGEGKRKNRRGGSWGKVGLGTSYAVRPGDQTRGLGAGCDAEAHTYEDGGDNT